MKQILYTALILLLFSCKESTVDTNTEKTIKWIETHKRPIQVETFICDKEMRNYTLFSADNKLYATGTVDLELPALIVDSVKIPDGIVIDKQDTYEDFIEQAQYLEKQKRRIRYIEQITE